MRLENKHDNIYVDSCDIQEGVNLIPVTGGEILIHIPIETLFYAMNHRQDCPLRIYDKKRMVEYVTEWLSEWGGNQDTGSTAFEDFLDGMFTDALESGEEWLDMDECI